MGSNGYEFTHDSGYDYGYDYGWVYGRDYGWDYLQPAYQFHLYGVRKWRAVGDCFASE